MSRKQKLQKNSVIVITGPTASGKTSLAIELAKTINSEIISADSRQIYKYMDICTAKPSKDELKSVKHHLIDFLDPSEDYSAGKFVSDANIILNNLINNNVLPIICGGSGFYIKSLFDGLFEEKSKSNPEIRNKLNKEFKQFGLKYIQEKLNSIDPNSYTKIDLDNPHRLIRALEYYFSTGELLSEAHRNRNQQKSKFDPIYFAIDYQRKDLYSRINDRCEEMWNNGLVNEYKSLINLGYDKDLNSLNTVGYKESRDYIYGVYSESVAIEEFRKNTRRFAKRQLTWFRKNQEIYWLDGKQNSKLNQIKDILEL